MSIFHVVPMLRLTDRMVRSGLVMAWRLATSPISTSPPLEKATTDGVVRDPSALGITTGSPASSTATTEFVVPRSIPTGLGMSPPFSWLQISYAFQNINPAYRTVNLEQPAVFPSRPTEVPT